MNIGIELELAETTISIIVASIMAILVSKYYFASRRDSNKTKIELERINKKEGK